MVQQVLDPLDIICNLGVDVGKPYIQLISSPELAPLFAFLLFWGSLCFPLTRQKIYFFAGVLIPAKKSRSMGICAAHISRSIQLVPTFWIPGRPVFFFYIHTPSICFAKI